MGLVVAFLPQAANATCCRCGSTSMAKRSIASRCSLWGWPRLELRMISSRPASAYSARRSTISSAWQMMRFSSSSSMVWARARGSTSPWLTMPGPVNTLSNRL